jgi:hypothetical protein
MLYSPKGMLLWFLKVALGATPKVWFFSGFLENVGLFFIKEESYSLIIEYLFCWYSPGPGIFEY